MDLFAVLSVVVFTASNNVLGFAPLRSNMHIRRSPQPVETARHSKTTTTTTLFDSLSAKRYVSDGMQAFREGRVKESIRLFDAAEREEPRLTPYLWQRGLSYYYDDDFNAASRQFRTDVRVNPTDVEEIVWDIASQKRRGDHVDMLNLPMKDRRVIMGTVYQLFRNETSEKSLAAIGTQSASDEFYALFYLALFAEGNNETTKAEHYMKSALVTSFAKRSNDYMVAVAKVHAQLRGWAKTL